MKSETVEEFQLTNLLVRSRRILHEPTNIETKTRFFVSYDLICHEDKESIDRIINLVRSV